MAFLQTMYIDTHAHIYLDQFDDDRAAMIQRARAAGVGKILMPNIDATTIAKMHDTEALYPDLCFAMMGLHPCSVGADFEKVLGEIEQVLRMRDYVAVGEIGLDLYWDKTFVSEQMEAFKVQVGWAHQLGLPIVIHSRQSSSQLLEALEALALPGLTGVFHCFSGTKSEAQRIIDLGFYLGIGGVVTFKNGGLDKILPMVPLDHIILETDSPYLAPHPHRGKRNESAYVVLVAEKLKVIYNTPLEQIEFITTQNAMSLFGSLPPTQ